MLSGPPILPTVAPMPAPTLPMGPSSVLAAAQAASPSAGPGRASQLPTARSNSTAAGEQHRGHGFQVRLRMEQVGLARPRSASPDRAGGDVAGRWDQHGAAG